MRADAREYKALPALRASLKWYKRETIRRLERRASETSPAIGAQYLKRAQAIRETKPAALRGYYLTERTADIRSAGAWYLALLLGEKFRRLEAVR